MPELPEVETIKRSLAVKITGQRILKVTVHDDRVLRNCSASVFMKTLTGRTFKDISRRGKALIFSFNEPGFMVVQPMMTGQLIFSQTPSQPQIKIVFHLSNGNYLLYNDQRLFGRINFYQDLKEMDFLKTLGPEPFGPEFNSDWLQEKLAKRKVPIKSLLLNQQIVAGIGNIYACEILFDCGINPKRPAQRLKKQEIKALIDATTAILQKAIHERGTSMHTYVDGEGQKGNFIKRIKVYGRENEPCVKCRRPIERIVQSGRSTFYCRRCQR